MLVLGPCYHSPVPRLSAPTETLLLAVEHVCSREKPVWGDNPAERYSIFCGSVCRLGSGGSYRITCTPALERGRRQELEGERASLNCCGPAPFGTMAKDGLGVNLKGCSRVQQINISPSLRIPNVNSGKIK